MELELLKEGLASTKNKKRWGLVLGALGLAGYGVYRIYNLTSVVKKRERLFKLLGALFSVAEMVSYSAEAIGIISKDLKEFMHSDSNQIPQSFQQLSKITRSNEFCESLTRISRALTVGILRGYQHELTKNGCSFGAHLDFSDLIMDKLFSSAGSGFASVVVGTFARNLVMAFFSNWQQDGTSVFDKFSNADDFSWKSNQSLPRLVEFVCDQDNCRQLIGDCIQLFVSTAVAVYLDKTMNINTCDEIISGLTNPKHEAKVKDMMTSVCNNAVETFIRTSHQVWTTGPNSANYSDIDLKDNYIGRDEKTGSGRRLSSPIFQARKIKNRDGEFMRKMSSTQAVQSNRKFVLDMTGMVAFESVRSFLEFLLQKLSECVKRSVDAVHEEVIDRGFEGIRYVSGKSSAVTAMCLTLCLHILNSPWILAPY